MLSLTSTNIRKMAYKHKQSFRQVNDAGRTWKEFQEVATYRKDSNNSWLRTYAPKGCEKTEERISVSIISTTVCLKYMVFFPLVK